MDRERARVDVADRVDQAHDPPRAAQVQPRQRLAVGRQVEERVAGQHLARRAPAASRRARAAAPAVGCSSSQTSAPRPDGRSRVSRRVAPYRSASALNSSSWATFCRVTTTEILASPKPAFGQVLQRADRHVERTRAADGVVDLRRRAVERDLHVDVVDAGEPGRDLRRDADAVGGELHADVVRRRVVDQLPEVGPDGRLAAADVDVEDLHPLQLVDDRLALRGAQLARVAPARGRQAVHAGTGCTRTSAPTSGRSARPARARTARPAVGPPRWSRRTHQHVRISQGG